MLQSLSKWFGVALLCVLFTSGWIVRHPSAAQMVEHLGEPPPFTFEDITSKAGINFAYKPPVFDKKINGKRDFIFVGTGVAVADFNGDGWMDIFFVNAGPGSKNQLYLNQHGKGFKESAEEWGIADTNSEGASVSAVVFDYDNDGRPDIYLARLGCSMLFHNLGNRFENVTAKSGLGDCRGAVSAVPLDFDGDGKLDLYVVRYWNENNLFQLQEKHSYLFTENFYDAKNGGENNLYRNRGDGTFEDVTKSRGGSDSGWSWDAGAADLEGNGVQKLYVANDFGPDSIWNASGGNLLEGDNERILGTVDRRAGMGVSFGDLAHDGRPHMHVSNESQKFYNPSHGNFLWYFAPELAGKARDEAGRWGTYDCGNWSWGSAFGDFDLDGQQDLYVAAGMITGLASSEDGSYLTAEKRSLYPDMEYDFTRRSGMTIPGIMADLPDWPDLKDRSIAGGSTDCVFWNRGNRFRDVALQAGISKVWDGRAVALIDFDNNGSLDLVVTTRKGPPHLLKNSIAPAKHWVMFSLRGVQSNRDGAGARLELLQPGQRAQYRWATAGKTGFLASSDPRIHFGIPSSEPFTLNVHWPSGRTDTHQNVAPGRVYTVTEGGGLK